MNNHKLMLTIVSVSPDDLVNEPYAFLHTGYEKYGVKSLRTTGYNNDHGYNTILEVYTTRYDWSDVYECVIVFVEPDGSLFKVHAMNKGV